MLYPIDERAAAAVARQHPAAGHPPSDDPAMDEAARNLRALIMAGERYRLAVAGAVGLGTTESQAVSYLSAHGSRGQSELARDLSLTSSAATALVDRLERHGAAERARHPSDRRRTIIRLTEHGERLAAEGQRPLLATLAQVEADDLPKVAGWLGAIADELQARTLAAASRSAGSASA